MNKKLFGRDEKEAQLRELYRSAEGDGQAHIGADPELQQVFAADRQVMRQLSRLADRSGPANPAIGRATLLAEVARAKGNAPEKERRPMIGQFVTGKALALIATAAIFSGGAVTVGASGGVSGAAGNVQNVLATLGITNRAADQAGSHLNAIDQPDASGKPSDPGAGAPGGGLTNAGDHANTNAAGGLQNADERGDNAGQGADNANGHAADAAPADAGVPAAVPPVTLPTAAADHASGGATNGAVPLPTAASDRASQGAGNAPAH